tara:strand:- start:661 stop:1200 length:540 start_codon:yes stop_codon:yes gene_type:complete
MSNIERPLLTNTFLNFFNKLDLSNSTYLEIGSGNSTIYFSKIFKNIISFEDDLTWFHKLNKLNIPNLKLEFFDTNSVFNTCVPCIGRVNPLTIHLSKPNLFIMIDNNPIRISRLKFAEFIDKHKKEDSIIILDNGEKNYDAMAFLKSKYYCLDFPGTRYDNTFSVTSVFFNNKNYERII